MTRLTRVEAEANGIMVSEHRAAKCHRCQHRRDLKHTKGFLCGKGEATEYVMTMLNSCRSWMLDENTGNWLNEGEANVR